MKNGGRNELRPYGAGEAIRAVSHITHITGLGYGT